MKKEQYTVYVKLMDELIHYIMVEGWDSNGDDIQFCYEEGNLADATQRIGYSGFAFGDAKFAFVGQFLDDNEIYDAMTELIKIFSYSRNGGDMESYNLFRSLGSTDNTEFPLVSITFYGDIDQEEFGDYDDEDDEI